MTYTAVEKDQNITFRVQCYNSTLPPPTDLDLGAWTTTTKSWSAQIHNINCTKPNSNTQHKCRKFCELFLLPSHLPTTFVPRQSITVLSQIKLWATALILYLVLKTVISFSGLMKGPQTWKILTFYNCTSWSDRKKIVPSQTPQSYEAELNNIAWGARIIYTGFHQVHSYDTKVTNMRLLNKRFSLFCITTCQLQARYTSQPVC